MNSTHPAIAEMKNSSPVQTPSTLSPFRYPGGKSGLRSKIIRWLGDLGFRPQHFLESFAGGASVGLAVAELDLADHVTSVEVDPDGSAICNVIVNVRLNELSDHV